MSTAHRYRSYWRDLVFNQQLDDTGLVDDPAHVDKTYARSDYRLEGLDLTRVETTDYRELRQWFEGAEGNEAYEGVMLVRGWGVILGATHGELEDRTATMRSRFSVASCRLAAATADPVGVLPFAFRRATAAAGGSLALQFFARPATGRPTIVGRMREGLSRRFEFNLVAFDPRLYSQTLKSGVVPVAGATTLTNAGDMYTSPKIVVVIAGATGNLTVAINGVAAFTFAALPTGTWTIDTAKSTITRASDGANGYSYRTSGYMSNGWLNAGDNVVDTTGSAGLASVTFQYRDAYA